MFFLQFTLVLVVGIPGQAGQAHDLGIDKITIKLLGQLSDNLFRFNAFLCNHRTVLLLGHTNYLDTCYALWDNLHQDEKREVFGCDAVDTIGQTQ